MSRRAAPFSGAAHLTALDLRGRGAEYHALSGEGLTDGRPAQMSAVKLEE